LLLLQVRNNTQDSNLGLAPLLPPLFDFHPSPDSLTSRPCSILLLLKTRHCPGSSLFLTVWLFANCPSSISRRNSVCALWYSSMSLTEQISAPSNMGDHVTPRSSPSASTYLAKERTSMGKDHLPSLDDMILCHPIIYFSAPVRERETRLPCLRALPSCAILPDVHATVLPPTDCVLPTRCAVCRGGWCLHQNGTAGTLREPDRRSIAAGINHAFR